MFSYFLTRLRLAEIYPDYPSSYCLFPKRTIVLHLDTFQLCKMHPNTAGSKYLIASKIPLCPRECYLDPGRIYIEDAYRPDILKYYATWPMSTYPAMHNKHQDDFHHPISRVCGPDGPLGTPDAPLQPWYVNKCKIVLEPCSEEMWIEEIFL